MSNESERENPYNTNSVSMDMIEEIFMRNSNCGPTYPFDRHIARRHAIEQVRYGIADKVVA